MEKGYGEDFIDLSGYKCGHEAMAITQSKAVKQYSLKGEYIQTFLSVKQAAQKRWGYTGNFIRDR